MPPFLSMAANQHGPPDQMFAGMRYFWILPLVLAPTIVLVLYLLLFPRLTNVKATDEIKPSLIDHRIEEMSEESSVVGTPQVSAKVEAIAKARIEAVLQVIGEDERKVVHVLMESGGQMLQKEVSWKTGFSRVKTHRVLVKLLRRGLVSAEKYYNTNRITLANWLLKGRPTDEGEGATGPAAR